MKRLLTLIAVISLCLITPSASYAATNLNSSRSNVYRVIYDTTAVSEAQASALLVELDKLGAADEAKLKKWLPANFKRLGIQGSRIKKLSVRRVDKGSPILILILTNPSDETAALALSNEGIPDPKSVPKE